MVELVKQELSASHAVVFDKNGLRKTMFERRWQSSAPQRGILVPPHVTGFKLIPIADIFSRHRPVAPGTALDRAAL